MAARRRKVTPFVERKSSGFSVNSIFGRREVWIGIIVVLVIFGVVRFRERMASQQEGARPTPSVNGGTSQEEKEKGKAGELANVSGKVEVVAKEGETFTSISQKYCGSTDFAQAISVRNGGEELVTGDKIVVECVK